VNEQHIILSLKKNCAEAEVQPDRAGDMLLTLQLIAATTLDTQCTHIHAFYISAFMIAEARPPHSR